MNLVPNHIAIIMDGNGRWAENNNLPRTEGHRHGVERVEEIVEACADKGVKFLTLYAFSDENWLRSEEEVGSLMELLVYFLDAKCSRMIEKGIRFNTIGDISKLSENVVKKITEVKEKTSGGKRIELFVALSYGSHMELARAFSRLAAEGKKEITPEDIAGKLDTAGVPDPDLLIRTSGEIRISNFMLWQIAYSELYFTETLWPDFKEEDLFRAIEEYQRRDRRFGRVKEGVK